MPRRTITPYNKQLCDRWLTSNPVFDLEAFQRDELGAPVHSGNMKTILLLAGIVVVVMVVVGRKPIMTVIDKTKVNELVKKYGNVPFSMLPEEAKPDSLKAAYSKLSTVRGSQPLSAKEIIDTIPIKDLWGIRDLYTMPAQNATASSVSSIAATPQLFVEMIKPAAIKIARKYGFKDPKLVAAQAAHEGNWGKNAIGGTNLFGHIATKKWADKGGRFSFERTREVKNGVNIQTVRPFRVYDSVESAIDHHFSDIILPNFPRVLDSTTVVGYVQALYNGKGGRTYATEKEVNYLKRMREAYTTIEKYWGS